MNPKISNSPSHISGARTAARLSCILSATVYLGTMAAAFCAEPLANIDSALQKLALHAKQSMPAANVAGVHGQNAKINNTDRTQIPGRFDDKDRVLVHVHLDGRSSLDEVTKQLESLVLLRSSTWPCLTGMAYWLRIFQQTRSKTLLKSSECER
jgi:hypothetical protein